MSAAEGEYLRAWGVELGGSAVNGKALEVSRLVSLREEGLARLKGMHLEVPCCVVARSEAKGEMEVVKEGVGVLKEKVEGYSIYVLL